MSRNVNSFRADQAKQVEDLLDRLRQHDNIQDKNVAPVTKPVEIKAQNIQEAPAHRQVNIEKQYSDKKKKQKEKKKKVQDSARKWITYTMGEEQRVVALDLKRKALGI